MKNQRFIYIILVMTLTFYALGISNAEGGDAASKGNYQWNSPGGRNLPSYDSQ